MEYGYNSRGWGVSIISSGYASLNKLLIKRSPIIAENILPYADSAEELLGVNVNKALTVPL